MTNEQIRIVIAESVGLNLSHDKMLYCEHGLDIRNQNNYKHIPDYPNDLNTMHEAEKTLVQTNGETVRYLSALEKVLVVGRSEARTNQENFRLIHATAHQRAEAYLRTKGLWKP